MFFKHLLIVSLIGALSLRDDVGALLGWISCASALVSANGPNDDVAAVEETNDRDEDEVSDCDDADNCPDNDAPPAQNDSPPGIPDDTDESNAEEKCAAESKLDSKLARLHFSIETDRSLHNIVTSSPRTLRLRI